MGAVCGGGGAQSKKKKLQLALTEQQKREAADQFMLGAKLAQMSPNDRERYFVREREQKAARLIQRRFRRTRSHRLCLGGGCTRSAATECDNAMCGECCRGKLGACTMHARPIRRVLSDFDQLTADLVAKKKKQQQPPPEPLGGNYAGDDSESDPADWDSDTDSDTNDRIRRMRQKQQKSTSGAGQRTNLLSAIKSHRRNSLRHVEHKQKPAASSSSLMQSLPASRNRRQLTRTNNKRTAAAARFQLFQLRLPARPKPKPKRLTSSFQRTAAQLESKLQKRGSSSTVPSAPPAIIAPLSNAEHKTNALLQSSQLLHANARNTSVPIALRIQQLSMARMQVEHALSSNGGELNSSDRASFKSLLFEISDDQAQLQSQQQEEAASAAAAASASAAAAAAAINDAPPAYDAYGDDDY
jgi:hypothetical protein